MKLPKITKAHSLKMACALFVLNIMCIAGIICISIITILHAFRIVPTPVFLAPIIVIIISIIIGTILASNLSETVLAPIHTLIKSINQAKSGDFSGFIPADDFHGEFKELAENYNSMLKELSGTQMLNQDFINTFSHEFKTPIVSIRGFAKQLKRKDLSDDEREEYTDIIISEAQRLAQLSNTVLLLTQLENSEISYQTEPLNLAEQIRSCILVLEKKWTEKDIMLDIQMPDTINVVSCEELLRHIWNNLLDNAIKFSPRGGVISVVSTVSGNNVHVMIKNNGESIPKDKLPRIFDKFYQSDLSHKTEGNGLGLALVKRAVEIVGGKVSVESTPERGTVFEVSLRS